MTTHGATSYRTVHGKTAKFLCAPQSPQPLLPQLQPVRWPRARAPASQRLQSVWKMQRGKHTGDQLARQFQVGIQTVLGPCVWLNSYIQNCLHLSIIVSHVNWNSNSGACCMKWTYTTGSPAEDFGTGDHNYCRDFFVIHWGIQSNGIFSCLNIQEPGWSQ